MTTTIGATNSQPRTPWLNSARAGARPRPLVASVESSTDGFVASTPTR